MSIFIQKIKDLPSNPGCYLFKDRAGQVLYIGKAKNLRKRVVSYFQKHHPEPKTVKLVSEITDLEFLITDTELEALLLEAKLIREQQPKYNMELKGGRRYAYIRVTNEIIPRLETARTVRKKDMLYGPYARGGVRQQLMYLANDLFQLRVGKRKPDLVKGKYAVRLSRSPWKRYVTPEEYAKDIDKVELLLKGKMPELIGRLELEMRKLSSEKKYELAKQRRDQIFALRQLGEKQKISLRKSYDQDVINYAQVVDTIIVQLFTISKGEVFGRKEFRFKEFNLHEFLTQYYYSNEIPQEIILPKLPTESKLVEKYLTKISGRGVRLLVPQKGDKKKLLDLVLKNIKAGMKSGDAALLELQNELSLPKLPRVIECFDISNLGPTHMVGSMVYFKDGLPDKNNYRRFKIKTLRGQSDVDAIQEIVYRRYSRLLAEQASLPHLVVVDGGKPQLSAARKAFARLGLVLPVVALAKKQEELFLPGRGHSIILSRKSDALKLVQKIRDEAHRFAITYHRLLRSKGLKKG